MNIEVIKLEDITPAERNIRTHGDKQIAEFVKSVEQFGQIRPIVTDEDLVIIAGHGLHQAMTEMGETEARVLRMIGLTDAEKKKLMLADNKIYELGNLNNDNIMAVLEEINMSGEGLDIPGYDMEVLENILGEMEDIDEVLSDYGAVSEEKIVDIREAGVRHEERMVDNKPREMVLNPEVIQVEQKSQGDVPKPYVVCGNCGEKIWL